MTCRPFVVSLALGACDPRDDLCRAGEPALVLGVGEDAFVEAVDGTEAPVTFGGQGGWHVWVALAATGLPEARDVVVRLAGALDGEEVAPDGLHAVSFRCDRREGRFEAWGLPLQFAVEPEEVAGRAVDVSARLDLPDGVRLEADVSLVLAR